MPFLKTTTLTILLLMLSSMQSHAAPLKESEATHLKTMIETLITEYKTNNDTAAATLIFDGEVESEIADTHYAITLPHAALEYASGAKINIGFITINAKPAKIEGGWNMAIAIPTPIQLIDEKGKTAGQINIAQQSTTGIWMEDDQLFLKLNGQYKDIALNDAAENTAFEIPEMTYKQDFDADENGLWSGPAQLKIKDLKTTLQPTGAKLAIGEIAGYSHLDKFNPKILQNQKETLAALQELGTTNTPNSPQHSIAYLNLGFETLKNSFNDTKFGVKLEDINYTSAANLFTLGTPKTTHIDSAHASFELNDLTQNASGIRVRTGFKGTKNLGDEDIQDLLPSDMLLDITLDKIPMAQLLELAQSTVKNMHQNPQISGLSSLTLMLKIPAILSAAGTNMEIKQNYITGPDYNIDLNGIIKAEIIATNSATANAKAIITGLDQFLAKADEKLKNMKDETQKEQLQDIVTQLKNIKNFAKETPSNSPEISQHEITFIMDKNGKMLLNGADISLLSMMMGQGGGLMKNFMPK